MRRRVCDNVEYLPGVCAIMTRVCDNVEYLPGVCAIMTRVCGNVEYLPGVCAVMTRVCDNVECLPGGCTMRTRVCDTVECLLGVCAVRTRVCDSIECLPGVCAIRTRACENVECLPGVGAVFVEDVELVGRYQLTPVDAWLDGPESTQDPHLFNVTDNRHDIEALQLRVDGVEAPNQVLQEQLEGLRQTDELPAVDDEGGHLDAAVFDQATGVVLGAAVSRWRGTVDGLRSRGHHRSRRRRHGQRHGTDTVHRRRERRRTRGGNRRRRRGDDVRRMREDIHSPGDGREIRDGCFVKTLTRIIVGETIGKSAKLFTKFSWCNREITG